MPQRIGVRIWLMLLLAAMPGAAHHAVSLYDMKQPITLQGVVSRVVWENPHAYVYLAVKNDQGATETCRTDFDPIKVVAQDVL